MRIIDKIAIEEYRIPGLILMENAAISIFNLCKTLKCYQADNSSVVIFCGTGNNGGDGFALARHMINDSAKVSVVVVGDHTRIKGDAKVNYDMCVSMGIEIKDFNEDNRRKIEDMLIGCNLIVDAIIGTGIKGKIKQPISTAIEMINNSEKFVVAIDSPTGGDPDNGQVSGLCVKANLTITLGFIKPGLLMYPLADYTGDVERVDISLPRDIWERVKPEYFAIDLETAGVIIPKRPENSHKGTFGKVALIAGSTGMVGAAAFSAKAAYKAGCGYVTVHTDASIMSTLQQLVPQAVLMPLSDNITATIERINKSSVCLLGPGLGVSDEISALVKSIIRQAQIPLIIDADGLNAVSDEPTVLLEAHRPTVITPHPLEMSRLTGAMVESIIENPAETALRFSKSYNTITILKGAATVIASPDGRMYLNKGACSALAKAGSGDILAGLLAGLIAQGMGGAEAGALAAFIHSQCGRIAAEKYSDYAVCSDDLINCMGDVFLMIDNRAGSR